MIKVSAATYEALCNSIKKWTTRSQGKHHGAGICPLCELHHPGIKRKLLHTCGACPIKLSSGFDFCKMTPYDEYSNLLHTIDLHDLNEKLLYELNAAAQAEVDYLIALRDKCVIDPDL